VKSEISLDSGNLTNTNLALQRRHGSSFDSAWLGLYPMSVASFSTARPCSCCACRDAT